MALIKQTQKKEEKRAFAFFVASITIWLISMLLVIEKVFGSQFTLYLARIQNSATAFAAFFFLYFIINSFYINKNKFIDKLTKIAQILTILISLLSLFTNTIISNIDLSRNAIIPPPIYGPLISLFAIIILVNLLLATIIIFLNRHTIKKQDKYILKSVITSILIAALVGLLTNLILPSVTGKTDYSAIGPLSMVLVTGIISYAIIKHQFLDVRVLFGRITYFVLVGTIFMLTYYGIYFLDIATFGSSKAPGAIISGIFNAIIFAIFFVKFNEFLRKEVRSRIINPGYDPLEETDQLSRKVASTLSIRDISRMTIEVFTKTLRPNYSSIVVFPDNEKANNLTFDTPEKKIVIDDKTLNLLTSVWNKVGKQSIVLDELDFEMPKRFESVENEIAVIAKSMQQMDIKLIVPLTHENKNSGFIALGKKEADSPYSMQDIQFVQGIASTLELALTRSLYFLEVEDLNINLQKRVDVATADLKTKNTELTDAMNKLQEIRRRERDMVDVMGHELRTPITIVRNALLFLQSQLESGGEITKEKLIEYVDKAVESSRREISLVETLLSATKIDANRIQLNLTKIDMLDVVNDSLEALKETASEKALEIRYEKPAQEYWGFADRNRTQEIMDNFLSNAIKYTQKGFVEITIGQTDKEAFISVKDSGIGIHKTDLENLGKKFYRAKQYTDSKGDTNIVRPGGTGLGLYVSFNLIKMMGGRVQIQSEPGQGSTFTMLLPLYSGQEDKHVDQTFD